MTANGPTSYFRPFHSAHAIVEMVAFYEFTRQNSASSEFLFANPDDVPRLLGQEFNVQAMSSHEIEASQGGISFRTIPAYALQKGPDPEQPDWVIRIEPLAVSIHALKYTRWEVIHPEIQRLADIILDHAATRPVNLAGLGLRYLDQFQFVGDPATYDARLLLKPNAHLNPAAFTSSIRWHCHTGWFDGTAPEILNQLNVNSVLPPPDAQVKMPVIAIEHAQILRNQSETIFAAFFKDLAGPASRRALMQRLHETNKTVMFELLNPRVAKQINLAPKKAEA